MLDETYWPGISNRGWYLLDRAVLGAAKRFDARREYLSRQSAGWFISIPGRGFLRRQEPLQLSYVRGDAILLCHQMLILCFAILWIEKVYLMVFWPLAGTPFFLTEEAVLVDEFLGGVHCGFKCPRSGPLLRRRPFLGSLVQTTPLQQSCAAQVLAEVEPGLIKVDEKSRNYDHMWLSVLGWYSGLIERSVTRIHE